MCNLICLFSFSDNNLPTSLKSILRRSFSERRLSDTTLTATVSVIFNDTTALRSKPLKTDSRNIFQEILPSTVTRPRDPPPPPPSIQKTPERPPRISGRKFNNFSIEENARKIDENYEEFNFMPQNVATNNHNHMDEVVELKVSNARNVTSLDENNEQRKRIQANIEAFQGSRIFGSVNKKTVVKVAPLIINRESPGVHRLEVKNDEQECQNENKKTSILINGDDCYSTINVNDDTPLYQSSVVVHDSCTSPAITKSNTVSISVTTPQTPEEQMTYHHNHINTLLSKNCARSIIPINDSHSGNVTQRIVTNPNQTRTLITLDYSDRESSYEESTDSKSENELVLLLRNPVEAVKRNLVPHVCGKIVSETGSIENNNEKQSKSDKLAEKLLQTDNTSFISKLLEDPTLGHLAEGLDYELVAKLIENSLVRLKESRNSLDMSGTKDEKDMNKLIETSLQKVKEERHKMEIHKSDADKPDDDNKSNRDSMSSGNSFSSANYEPYDFDGNDLSDCYQSCSSELTADEDGNMTRSKFYQMLVDATLSEIEISTNIEDDHHYESIRLNGDPIYEEISDIPPPLPLCPPPTDVELEKKNAKSMFEGASKYDILSYLVDAKERGIVPEDSYTYNFGNSSDVIIEEENDKVSGRLHNRQNSDISCRISHISSNSDVSDEASLKQSAQRKSSADIERNDSGVGSETSKTSRSKYQSLPGSILNKNSPIHLCEDCDGPVETQVTDSGVMFAPLVCRKCGKKRAERKEIVTEIVETEEKYGRDLQIILEEFYQPMLVCTNYYFYPNADAKI